MPHSAEQIILLKAANKPRVYPTPQKVIDYHNWCEKENRPMDAWSLFFTEFWEAIRIRDEEHEEALKINTQMNFVAQI